jgi:hypothetical protein
MKNNQRSREDKTVTNQQQPKPLVARSTRDEPRSRLGEQSPAALYFPASRKVQAAKSSRV